MSSAKFELNCAQFLAQIKPKRYCSLNGSLAFNQSLRGSRKGKRDFPLSAILCSHASRRTQCPMYNQFHMMSK